MLLLSVGQTVAQKVTVNLSSEQQVIRGFGGMSCVAWIGDLTTDQVDKAFGNGVDQLGFSILRIRVPNDASQFSKEVASPKRAISMHGAIVFASPWSPPASMKSNNNTISGHLNTSSYSAYAAHLKSFCDYMSSNGAPLYAISVQNEPDIKVSYESCDWTADQIVTFLKQNALSIGATKIIAPESFQYKKGISDPILKDPSALDNMDILGAHIYGTNLNDFPYPLFKQNGAGKELWMTEHYTESSHSADDWPLALDAGYEVHNCMVEAEFNAYIWWYIRRSYGPIKENGQISKRGYCIAHYSKFARPGYVRIDATKKPMADVYVSAYKGKDSLVIVAVNKSSSSKTIELSIPNTTAKSFTKFTTSGSKNLSNDGTIPVNNGSCSVPLDAQSMTTLAGTSTTTSVQDNNGPGRRLLQNRFGADGSQMVTGEHFDYRIFDMSGSIRETGSGTDALTIGSSLAPGVYFLSVKSALGDFAGKILMK
jgi:glucuronoarabinoxylan endo-1,4-beta-xylanase